MALLATIKIDTSDQIPYFYINYNISDEFIDRLNYYFEFNDIDNEQKKKILLLTHVCVDTFKTLKQASYPKPVRDKSYAELCDLIRKFSTFQTKNAFLDRRKFYTATQDDYEPVSEWVERVKEYSEGCKFKSDFEGILVDRFITGMKQSLAFKAFSDVNVEELTLEKAVRLASFREAAHVMAKVPEEDTTKPNKKINKKNEKTLN